MSNENEQTLHPEATSEEPPVNLNLEDQTAEQNQENTGTSGEGETLTPPPEEKKQPTPEELIAAINDKYLRLRADFDNYMKRMARETNDIREHSKKTVICEFLPVYDFFQMAMQHSESDEDIKVLRQGMNMICSEFGKAFEALGVKEMKTAGETFDPKLHEAVKSEPSDTVPEGIIIKQWKAGYTMGDKLLRPAMVVVSSGAPKPTENH